MAMETIGAVTQCNQIRHCVITFTSELLLADTMCYNVANSS